MISADDYRFAFLDIETTGLDRDENYILEVAWVFTDAHFQQVSEPKSFIVDHGPDEIDNAVAQIIESDFLMNMHGTSGLYQDILNGRGEWRSMFEIMSEFADDATAQGAPTVPIRFAGYSVSFDREFLRSNGWWPLIEAKTLGFQMHHRILDISSLIQFFEASGRQVPFIENPNAHRALDDSIHAMRTVQEMSREISLIHPLDF